MVTDIPRLKRVTPRQFRRSAYCRHTFHLIFSVVGQESLYLQHRIYLLGRPSTKVLSVREEVASNSGVVLRQCRIYRFCCTRSRWGKTLETGTRVLLKETVANAGRAPTVAPQCYLTQFDKGKVDKVGISVNTGWRWVRAYQCLDTLPCRSRDAHK